MSLFDDLLNQKKPAQTGSGQSSGKQEDPLSVATSIIISASTPLISVAPDPIVIQEMPLMAPETATQTSWDNSPIIISADPTPNMGTTPTLVVATPQTEIITAVPIVAPSPLFDMSEPMNAPTATVVELVWVDTSMSSLFDGNPTTTPEGAPQKETETGFHDTDSYIEHAIDEVSDLIAGIDAEDAMVLAAEDEHRQQKEHFAELEIADEAKHQKHLEERAHAEKMKAYLEDERAGEVATV